MNSFSSPSTDDPKALILNQVRAENAMTNARALIDKLNHNCFDKCVPSPMSSSLANKEQQCFTTCMEKYLAAWNAVSRAYVNRIPKAPPGGGGGGGFGM